MEFIEIVRSIESVAEFLEGCKPPVQPEAHQLRESIAALAQAADRRQAQHICDDEPCGKCVRCLQANQCTNPLSERDPKTITFVQCPNGHGRMEQVSWGANQAWDYDDWFRCSNCHIEARLAIREMKPK